MKQIYGLAALITIFLLSFFVSEAGIRHQGNDARHIMFNRGLASETGYAEHGFQDFTDHMQTLGFLPLQNHNVNKSDQVFLQTLDSIIILLEPNNVNRKSEYTYDTRGNIILEQSYFLENSTWIDQEKTEYSYNDRGYLTDQSSYTYDRNTDTWTGQRRTAYERDENGLQTMILSFTWSNNNWVFSRKTEYWYDTYGNIIENKQSNYDNNTGIWTTASHFKTNHEYDSEGRNILITNYIWNSQQNDWVGFGKQINEYNTDGKTTAFFVYAWDSNAGDWLGTFKMTYEYDDHGRSRLATQWQWSDGDWLDVSRNTYHYNNDLGKLIKTLSEERKDGEWQPQLEEELGYDHLGNRTLKIVSYWPEPSEASIPNFRIEYEYDYSYSFNSLMKPTSFMVFPGDIENKLVEYKYSSWDVDGNSWIANETQLFYYSDIIPTHLKEMHSEFVLFPNPASSSVRLSGISGPASFAIYDIRGLLMQNDRVDAGGVVDLSALSSGIYIYVIKGDGFSLSGKLIRE